MSGLDDLLPPCSAEFAEFAIVAELRELLRALADFQEAQTPLASGTALARIGRVRQRLTDIARGAGGCEALRRVAVATVDVQFPAVSPKGSGSGQSPEGMA